MSFDNLEAEAKARLGRVLNEKWTLEELIGVGGMAAVYLARHRNEARAALKILHPALARHPGVRERFLREGYAANSVQHRGAVQVQDDDIVKGGEDDGAAYLVMELLEGESLEQRAGRSPPIGEQEYLTIANGVLSVLEAAHAHGVVHRDLKPENIFLARDPEDGHLRVKVLDFGLACLTDAQRTTGLGLALGTPSYMSPEQAAGRSEEIDGRTDLFALAATGFRLLARRRIHEEADVVRLVGRMANEPAPPIRSICPSVSESVAAIIDRGLAFKREDRYPNAAAMRADVLAARDVVLPSSTRLIAAAPTTSTPMTETEPTTALSESDLETSADASVLETSTEAPPPRRKRRSIMPLVTLAVFGAIGFAYVRSRDDVRTASPTPDAGTEADSSLAAAVVTIPSATPELDAEADDEDDAGLEWFAPTDAAAEPDAAEPRDAESLSAQPPPRPMPHPSPHPKRPPRVPGKRPPGPAHPAPHKR